MCVGLRVDQLDANTDSVARPLDAPFQHIAYSQLATDLLCIRGPVPIGKRGIARDDRVTHEPRQIGRQILGDAVCKILLFAVVAQIDEGQDHDRQAWWGGRSRIRNLLLASTLPAPAARADLGRELVSATGDRPDQVGVREGYAQRPDLSSQIALFDDAARPNAVD